jgi:hypothetical protein
MRAALEEFPDVFWRTAGTTACGCISTNKTQATVQAVYRDLIDI